MTMRKKKHNRAHASKRAHDALFEKWLRKLAPETKAEVADLLLGFQQVIFQFRGYLGRHRQEPEQVEDNPEFRKEAQQLLLRLKAIADRLGELGWPDYAEFHTSWDQDLAELVVG